MQALTHSWQRTTTDISFLVRKAVVHIISLYGTLFWCKCQIRFYCTTGTHKMFPPCHNGSVLLDKTDEDIDGWAPLSNVSVQKVYCCTSLCLCLVMPLMAQCIRNVTTYILKTSNYYKFKILKTTIYTSNSN